MTAGMTAATGAMTGKTTAATGAMTGKTTAATGAMTGKTDVVAALGYSGNRELDDQGGRAAVRACGARGGPSGTGSLERTDRDCPGGAGLPCRDDYLRTGLDDLIEFRVPISHGLAADVSGVLFAHEWASP
jgi:hypothetical protein